MNAAFNFHALFQNPTDTAFIKQLDLSPDTAAALDEAVSTIRIRLTPALEKLARDNGVVSPYARPRFRLQGSKVYKTQNAPAHSEQQVDVDFGVYIAAAFLDIASNGTAGRRLPAGALATAYFDVVDAILKRLCQEQGWKYVEGKKQKETCCRIDLSPAGHQAHIDVPLYAAPNEQFVKALKADEDLAKSFAEARADVSPEIDRDGWEELTVVVMATRVGEWEESDVQTVIHHFQSAGVRLQHPFILRRIWRYVKAWRDYIWPKGGGPSSVLLMEAVLRILDSEPDTSPALLSSGRDDLILHFVFSQLGAQLAGDVMVHWGRYPEDLNTGDATQRDQWRSMADAGFTNLDDALTDASLMLEQVIRLVQECFGQRIPSDVRLVRFLATTSAAPFVITAPKQQPSPQERIRRTTGA